MQTPNEPDELIAGGSLQLSSATEKLVATGVLNLSSPEDAESKRKNRDKDKEADLKDLSKVIENIGTEQQILSSVNLQSPEDAELERKLRELKFRQELRKDWILFIVRDVVVFSAALVFIFAVGGYSLFTLIRGSSFDDEKKFAISIALIVTGLVSFIAGTGQPPSSK